jgi:uncharacterized membrane protein HdeD (DUF308 family)
MLAPTERHWWILLLRGILALALGIAAVILPGIFAVALALLFGAYALIDGILAMIASIRMTHTGGRWVWLLIEGIISVVFGAAALVWPAISLIALVFLIGFWALLTGFAGITTAWRLRRVVNGEWFWILAGVLSVIFGIAVLLFPALGVIALVTIFAFYMILAGLMYVGVAIRLRSHPGTTPAGAA